jgi:hypothetical protein
MPSNSLSPPVMFNVHLWAFALSSMALPETALEMHTLLELPSADADGTAHSPRFVANWQLTLLSPVISTLLSSLSDDYEIPSETLAALIQLISDEATCAESFSIRLLEAPSRITHHSEILRLIHDSLACGASIDCSVHFTGAAAAEFKTIVNSIVVNTSFYLPPTPKPPTPTLREFIHSEHERASTAAPDNVTTRTSTSRARAPTVTFDNMHTDDTAPLSTAPPTDFDAHGPSFAWANRRSSNAHHLSPISNQHHTTYSDVDRDDAADPHWDSFARDDFSYAATSPSEVYARRADAAATGVVPTILRSSGSGGSRSSGGGVGGGRGPGGRSGRGGFGRGGGVSSRGPTLFDPHPATSRSFQADPPPSDLPGGGDRDPSSRPTRSGGVPTSTGRFGTPTASQAPSFQGSYANRGSGGFPGGGRSFGGGPGGHHGTSYSTPHHGGGGGFDGGGFGGGGPGGPGNNQFTDDYGVPLPRGATWTQFRVDSHTVDLAIDDRTGTIAPWTASRPDYGVIMCHALPLNLRQHDKAVFLSAFGRRAFDSNVIKEFLRNFPVFSPTGTGDPQYLLLAYFTRVVSYCSNFGVYLPPSHTLSSGDILGRWFPELPRNVMFLVQNSFAGFLAQAFQSKHTGLMSHESIKDVLMSQDDDGYLMYYQMHVLASHPRLLSFPSQDVEPRQSSDMTVGVYLQRWLHYVHIQLLHGIFVSDRYFLLQLIANMSPTLRDTVGRLLASDAIEKVPDINRKLPNSFAPDQLHIKLVELARHAGRPQLIIKTPRDLQRPSRDIRELTTASQPGFRHMMAQVSAPAAGSGFPPRRCFFCGKEDCTLPTCASALAAKSDPFTRRNLAKYFGIRALDLSSVENDSAPPSADEDTAGIVDLLSLDLNDESHALPSDSADLPPDSNFR